MSEDLTILTFTSMNAFLNCRRKYDLRYRQWLRPKEIVPAMYLGRVFHDVLKLWYKGIRDQKNLKLLIDTSFSERDSNEIQKRDWHLCHAMSEAYFRIYNEETFKIIEPELKFRIPIINPATGRASRRFELHGIVDLLVEDIDGLYIVEHKTTSQITGSYIEKLPSDFQINTYKLALSRHMEIKGVIYNIIQKASLKQSKGESLGEYEARKEQLIAKSKTGITTAKRQLPESDEEYRSRLRVKYHEQDMFLRVSLILDNKDNERTSSEIWNITQQILEARRRNDWSPNWSYCFNWNRFCPYWQLCRSNFNPNIRNNLYEITPPNEELGDENGTPD